MMPRSGGMKEAAQVGGTHRRQQRRTLPGLPQEDLSLLGLQWHLPSLCYPGMSAAVAHQLPRVVAVLLALHWFLLMLRDKHVLVQTDNIPMVAYINRHGGMRSRRMLQLACQLLLWSQSRLRSLRAVHIPGELNHAADVLSRQLTLPGEWRLHPQAVQLIWSRFAEAQ
ncbi:hypothetical protein M9458_006082, partial [Cirrhinus mrigala]